MQLSTTTNQTIDINNSSEKQVTVAKTKAPQQHSLWAHIKEDKATQAMLVVVVASTITNISVFL